MPRAHKILLALLLILAVAGLHAQNLEYRVTLGARAAALGESGLALPPSALGSYALSAYYNPAALGLMTQGESLVDYSNLFGSDVHEGVVALASPLPMPYFHNRQFGLGLLGNFEGISNGDVRYGRYIFSLAAGFALHRHLAVGAGFKAVVIGGQSREADIPGNEGAGYGFDLSLHSPIYFRANRFVRRLDLAFAVYDVRHTRLDYRTSTDILFNRSFHAGAAALFHDWGRVLRNPVVLAQIDDRWHLGAEATVCQWKSFGLTLRAGYARDRREPHESILTFGFGLKTDESAARARFDYAVLLPNGLLPTRHVTTISAPMWKGPPPLTIEPSAFAPVYASFFPSYTKQIRAGENLVRVKNNTAAAITGKFVKLEGIAGLDLDPKANASLTILPDSALTVRLHLKLTQEILAQQNPPQFKEARLFFQIEGRSKPEQHRLAVKVAGKNYLEWDTIAREAAFITKEDRSVQSFRAAMPAAEDSFWKNYPALFRAAQFYEALIANGFTYERDTEYRIDSLLAAKGLDHVRYPGELLASAARKGDCDDLVALYCALLESDNLATALVAAPHHIFMLFDTGIHASARGFLPLPDSLVFAFPNSRDASLRQSLWLPVEVTAIANKLPFDRAVQLGAAKFREHAADSAFVVMSTQRAQETFPPAHPTLVYPAMSFQPANEAARKALTRLLPEQKILSRLYQLMAQTQKSGAQAFDSTLQAATLLAFLDNLEGAHALLTKLSERKAFSSRYELLNNLGNVEFLHERYEQAERAYDAALALRPDFVQGYMNRILLYATWSEEEPHLSARLARFLRRDTAAVDSLHKLSQLFSLAEKQGLFLEWVTTGPPGGGRGSFASASDTLQSAARDSSTNKRASPKVKASVWQRVNKFFARLSYAFDPSDPNRRQPGGGLGEPVLASTRLVTVLYWCPTSSSLFARGAP